MDPLLPCANCGALSARDHKCAPDGDRPTTTTTRARIERALVAWTDRGGHFVGENADTLVRLLEKEFETKVEWYKVTFKYDPGRHGGFPIKDCFIYCVVDSRVVSCSGGTSDVGRSWAKLSEDARRVGATVEELGPLP